jgi:adenylate cyclase
MGSFEMTLSHGPLGARLRRAPFAVSLLLRTTASTAVLMAAIVFSRAILASRGHPMTDWLAIGFLRDIGFALLAVFAIHFVLQVRRIVGSRVLINFILGRYHQPLDEERIFMFLDVSGSTALAERLGGIGAYSMISRFFFDVAQETARYGGETHEYIGDEVVVTWPLIRGSGNARCLQCYFAICDRMESKAPRYKRDFGLVPAFRVGLHGGPIVAGECGDDKREIVYFGDTVNTAKRLQEACRDYERPMLISGDLMKQIELSDCYSSEDLGSTVLRGLSHETRLFHITRR